MISKSKIKLINSLSQKKFRDETRLFVAEGTKLVMDLIPAFQCSILAATSAWLKDHEGLKADETIETGTDKFNKISNLKSPQGVLAVFIKPEYHWNVQELSHKLTLALDDVQDPGNLGTIIRIADWFGITDIFCSESSVDAFNPKTVQATMGALARVKVHTVNLVEFLQNCQSELPIYGTFMDGENIYSKKLTQQGIIVMGNEGNGISTETGKLVTERLLIPNYPVGQITSESLNVAVATALICAEFRRRI
ncbi:MAG: RNA methyltransferase [Paludibacter sp.]|nr:RNA methyltransferase [Paludibacter sp.]